MPLTPTSRQIVSENQQLRQQLGDLLDKAYRNQQIMQRNQMLDLEFFGASRFCDLLNCLFRVLPSASELDVVTLALFDPEYEIRHILADLEIDLQQFPNLLFIQHMDEAGGALWGKEPVLGTFSAALHGSMFPPPLTTPASVALMPLQRHGRLIGYLNLGSLQPARFAADMATDFLAHRASVVAICIENVISQELLKHIGTTDALTRVYNRRYIEQRLLEEIGRHRRLDHAVSCLFIDIDHFKKINDSIGHQAGDQVLCEIAARIKAELRMSDTLGRFGGEEFIALLGGTEILDAVKLAQRIRTSIAARSLKLDSGHVLGVTVSVGVAALGPQDQTEDIESVALRFVARADEAMYRAKAEGRNRVVSSA